MSLSQEDLITQIKKLIQLADKNGLYDASDFLKRKLEENKNK